MLEHCSTVNLPPTHTIGVHHMKKLSGQRQSAVRLNRENVVAAASDLIRRDGIEGWSMRALSRELSVSVSTLYWHVRNEQDLLGMVIDEALAAIVVADTPDWRAGIADFLLQARRLLCEYPALVRLIWRSGWQLGPRTLRVTNDFLGLVARSGIAEDEVADAYYLLVAFLFGFVLMETQSPDTPDFVAERGASSSAAVPALDHLARYSPAADAAGMDRRFAFGVERLLNSLERGSAAAERPGAVG